MNEPDPRTKAATNRGALCGLLAAALFGVSAPLSKRLLGEMSPQVLAGLLYLGAGVGLSGWRLLRPQTGEAPIKREDIPTLTVLIATGGVLGPLLMLVGLNQVSAVTGSLLLNLEGLFTICLAVLFFREHLGRYGVLAVVLILAGAAMLRLEAGALSANVWGPVCITLACLAWAVDNNLTQRLSLRDPFAVVRMKALAAGSFNLAVGLLLGGQLPSTAVLVMALFVGSLAYGASVVLDAYALRLVGAAREAAYFATAPFVGALSAAVILGESLGSLDWAAMALMALGVVALLRERHTHAHRHEPLEHDHLHGHDEHHQHTHSPGNPVGSKHSHPHKHEPLEHDHPHVPDLHHRHKH